MIGYLRLVQICAVLTSLAGCKRQLPVERAEGTRDLDGASSAAADFERCRTSVNALPVAPLVVEWREEEGARTLILGTEGTVRRQRAVIARIAGPCILGLHGEVLLRVDGDLSVTGGQNDRVGAFRRQSEVRVQNGVIQVDEVFVPKDGVAMAVDSKGALYLVPTDRPAFSLPGHIKGDVSRARRTALLLWRIGHS